MKRTFLALLALFAVGVCHADHFAELSAEPGNYQAIDVGLPGSTFEAGVKLKFTGYNPSQKWPPAAYFGLYDPQDRNNKFLFLVIRNKPSDQYLVAGYRVIEDGKEAQVGSIANLVLGEEVRVHIAFKDGVVSLSMPGVEQVLVRTRLSTVQAYMSVSSGEAEFQVALNKQPKPTP